MSNINIGQVMAVARRSLLESANEQQKTSEQSEDLAFDRSIELQREALDAEQEKAQVDYHKSHLEAALGMLGPVGGAIAGAVTAGDDDMWVAGPVYMGYGAVRAGLRSEYEKAEADGTKPAWDNTITRTIVFADDQRGIAANERATSAKIDAKIAEKQANEAKSDVADAADARKQTLADARSMLEEIREASRSVNKPV